tara:strand:- start:24078 stop:24329 length:252 start_codon:yes stop_codon:yes gene_type:complete
MDAVGIRVSEAFSSRIRPVAWSRTMASLASVWIVWADTGDAAIDRMAAAQTAENSEAVERLANMNEIGSVSDLVGAGIGEQTG